LFDRILPKGASPQALIDALKEILSNSNVEQSAAAVQP
jgi:hypothetical protein